MTDPISPPTRADDPRRVGHPSIDHSSVSPNGTCQLLVDIATIAPPSTAASGGGGPPFNDKPEEEAKTAVLELRVRNHPGTMSHITGLFARRGFNLEAIVCVPVAAGATSCMLLLVAAEPRLEQVERQLAKLYDVLTVRHRPDLGGEFFYRLGPSGDGTNQPMKGNP